MTSVLEGEKLNSFDVTIEEELMKLTISRFAARSIGVTAAGTFETF